MKNYSKRKLYGEIPTFSRQNVSLNVLLSEESKADDGIKKELNVQLPKDYYNTVYHTRILKKMMFHKIICINQIL